MPNKDGDRFVNFLGNQFLKVPIHEHQMFQKRCVSLLFLFNNFHQFTCRTSLHRIWSCPISCICCYLWRIRVFNIYWPSEIIILAVPRKFAKCCPAIFIINFKRIWFTLSHSVHWFFIWKIFQINSNISKSAKYSLYRIGYTVIQYSFLICVIIKLLYV